jgi:outer membrane protein OmpA-like peptidoglycan-associated protein/tetratricopeptide (TPR) repeat protein
MEKIKIVFLCIISFCSVQILAQNKKAVECYLEANKQYREHGNTKKAIELLNKAIKKDPDFKDPYVLKVNIYEEAKDYGLAKESYINYLLLDSTDQTTYYFFAKMLMDSGDPNMASEIIDKFYRVPQMKFFNPKKDASSERIMAKINSLKVAISLAKEETQSIEDLNLTNLGPNINTEDLEYWPGMTMDKGVFIFTKLKRNDPQEDFYYSKIVNGEYEAAQLLPGEIRTNRNEGTVAIHPDGNTIYYTVCNQEDGLGSCDLYYSHTNGIDWSPRKNMGSPLNSASWDGQPTISMGGNVMIFCSGRRGGFGGKDLYMSIRNSDGSWSQPQNLGPTINTVLDEEAPFLHYDGRTLYFSSNGHPGMGGLDIFVSRLNDLEEWTTPKNIGSYINTSGEEMGFYVEPSGEQAYFVSDRPGGYGGLDIWSFKLKEEIKPAPANILTINIIDSKSKNPVTAKMVLTNLKNSRTILDTTLAKVKTYYPSGGNYGLFAQANGYLPFSQNYNKPLNTKLGVNESITIELVAAAKGSSIVVNNIFFDFDKWDLKAESDPALKALVSFLNSNPEIKIEIGGYTDNKGSDEHNKELSEKRSKSVSIYLMDKGIKATRLSNKGYGSLSTDDNSTEEKRALNRRIEIKIN